jgi:RNA polymerase sigma-70 factor, ECF subfamily
MNPDALIRAAQTGDRRAFAQLLEQYYGLIYRFALKWSGTVADAEDIAQLASLKLARGIRRYRFESAFNTWLYRLVVNCARDWHRSQNRHRHEELDGEPSGESGSTSGAFSGDNPADAAIYLRQVLARVEAIGDGFRETLVLVFAEGLTHRQAAEVLGIKESTVSWRIHEIRKTLNLSATPEGGRQ